MKLLLAALVRAVLRVVVMVVLSVVYTQWLTTTSVGDDALGAGLLYFLGVVVVAFGWSLWDAARRGFGAALLTWLIVAIVGAAALVTTIALADGDQQVLDQLKDTGVFFAILIVGPALIGAGIGGAIHGVRHRDDDAPQRAAVVG